MGEGCSTVFVVFVALIVVTALVFCVFVQPLGNPQEITATIDKTFIDHGDTYFVVKNENGSLITLSNDDNWWYGKTNSNDFFMNLEIGKKYVFETTGYRIPFLSCFPNMNSYEEVK